MQDKDKKPDQKDKDAAPASVNSASGKGAQNDFVRKIVDKVKSSENILIALSKSPSLDELSAAIGLTLFLESSQKHVTAIFSGEIPNSLAFLRPTDTFETNTDSLQDFIISLNKDKADHLRYKLEGDLVKVYITPYKTTISEGDLSFSHGDYNVDFVIAINVNSAGDLDPALANNGQIMRDASTVNITRSDPGRFGEIEWSNPASSSICEMMTELIFAIQGNDNKLDPDIATALLTGIVAATDRFSNNQTSSDTLGLASKLMTMGADQQLISSNVINVGGNDTSNSATPEPTPEAAPAPAAEPIPTGPMVTNPDLVPNPIPVNPGAAQATEPAAVTPAASTSSTPTPDTTAAASNAATPEASLPPTPGTGAPAAQNLPPAPATSSAPPASAPTPASQATTPVAPAPQATPAATPTNPAAAAAQSLPPAPAGPSPATFAIPNVNPELPADRAAVPPNLQAKSSSGVIVQPIVPVAPGSAKPVITTSVRPADTSEKPTVGPAKLGLGQNQTANIPMSYGQLMDQALAEGVPPRPEAPAGNVLPPPPAPPGTGNGMMPPSLPPVQV